MPATPHYPQSPTPSASALVELDRVGLEAARVLGRAGDIVVHVRQHPESISDDDIPLVREARRDIERCRIVLEGLCRTHRIEVSP